MESTPIKRPNTVDEVIIKKGQVVSGIVNVPVGNEDGLVFGTVVNTVDGGETWSSQERIIWVAGEHVVDAEVFHNAEVWQALQVNSNEPSEGADWTSLGEFDANGILGANIQGTEQAPVIVTGDVRTKHLVGYDASMKPALFKNKIILR
ncbi:hypothetical protein [Sulfurimonas sp.]